MVSILYLDEIPATLEALLRQELPEGFELWLWDQLGAHERPDRLAEADCVLVSARKVGADLIAGATKARLLQKIGVGTDNIDLDAAARHGLPVANAPGGNADAVAELTILLILAIYRQVRQLDTAIRDGQWPMWELRSSSYEMCGKVHGIVGLGAVGQAAARRSRAFGTTLTYFDIRTPSEAAELGASYRPLDILLRESDIVSVHVPLTAETRYLLGPAELASMKREAVLINVARGGVVDEGALYAALRDGRLAGAGVDVWDPEPPSIDNPLLRLDNVVATPHVGAGTRDTYLRVLAMALDNIRRVAAGEPARNVVER